MLFNSIIIIIESAKIIINRVMLVNARNEKRDKQISLTVSGDLKMIRAIDKLGRIVLPVEMRRALHVKEGDEIVLVLHTKENTVTLKSHVKTCIFCHAKKSLFPFMHRLVCKDCLDDLKTL